MPLVKILEDYGSAEQYNVGDIVEITNPYTLIAEGKVALVPQEEVAPIAPVAVEPEAPIEPVIEPVIEVPVEPPVEEVTEGSIAEGADEPAVPEQEKV